MGNPSEVFFANERLSGFPHDASIASIQSDEIDVLHRSIVQTIQIAINFVHSAVASAFSYIKLMADIVKILLALLALPDFFEGMLHQISVVES